MGNSISPPYWKESLYYYWRIQVLRKNNELYKVFSFSGDYSNIDYFFSFGYYKIFGTALTFNTHNHNEKVNNSINIDEKTNDIQCNIPSLTGFSGSPVVACKIKKKEVIITY